VGELYRSHDQSHLTPAPTTAATAITLVAALRALAITVYFICDSWVEVRGRRGGCLPQWWRSVVKKALAVVGVHSAGYVLRKMGDPFASGLADGSPDMTGESCDDC